MEEFKPLQTTEDCVLVLKVFDQCIKDEQNFDLVTIPEDACPTLPEGFTVDCEVANAFCTILDVSAPDADNEVVVTIQQDVTISITVKNTLGNAVCTFDHDMVRFNQVILFGPEGTFAQCEVVAAVCECDIIGERTLLCRIRLCKEIEMKAFVKLRIPTFGYCVAPPCDEVLANGDFECPPPDRFPPQKPV